MHKLLSQEVTKRRPKKIKPNLWIEVYNSEKLKVYEIF